MITYKTKGTCSESIDFEIENNIVTYCRINGGCTGNVAAISRLVIGKPVQEIIALLKGIQCHDGTSCPDQLAKALEEYSND